MQQGQNQGVSMQNTQETTPIQIREIQTRKQTVRNTGSEPYTKVQWKHVIFSHCLQIKLAQVMMGGASDQESRELGCWNILLEEGMSDVHLRLVILQMLFFKFER